jgi:hypothetical protein
MDIRLSRRWLDWPSAIKWRLWVRAPGGVKFIQQFKHFFRILFLRFWPRHQIFAPIIRTFVQRRNPSNTPPLENRIDTVEIALKQLKSHPRSLNRIASNENPSMLLKSYHCSWNRIITVKNCLTSAKIKSQQPKSHHSSQNRITAAKIASQQPKSHCSCWNRITAAEIAPPHHLKIASQKLKIASQ